MSINKATLEKLKKALKVSDSISIEQMRSALKMDKAIFDERIIDCAKEFGKKFIKGQIKLKQINKKKFLVII